MNALFSAVLTASLYGGLVGLILLAVKRLLAYKISSKWQLALWTVLILKLLIPFGPSSELSLFNLVPHRPAQATAVNTLNAPVNSNIPQVAPVNAEVSSVPYTPSAPVHIPVKKPFTPLDAAPYVWMGGVCASLGWFIFCSLSFRRKINVSGQCVNSRIMDVYRQCADELGLKRAPLVITQNAVRTPSLFALPRPVVLLNEHVNDMSDSELRYIFLHELSHYKRRDFILNTALVVIQSVHWFNPVLWLCFAKMREDMEQANDQSVLRHIQPDEHLQYAGALLSVLEKIPPLSPPLLSAAVNKEKLKRRINMIKLNEFFTKRKWGVSIISAVIIVALSIFLLTGATAGGQDDPDTSEQPPVVTSIDPESDADDNGVEDADDLTSYEKDAVVTPEGEITDDMSLGTIEDEAGVLIDGDVAIYVKGRKAVHMTIDGYNAWVAAGENDMDVYDYAERVIYTPIGKGSDEQMYMRIDDYKAWAAAGENDADVYDYAEKLSEIDLGDAPVNGMPDELYLWPLADYTRISALFGTRMHPIEKTVIFHDGIDIAAPGGTPVLAAKAGVVKTGENAEDGNFILIDHGDGLKTFYAHMSGYAEGLDTGDTVEQGGVIGYVGATGMATGNHLHFGVSIDDEYVNPMTYFTE